ncbi:MAG: hypothetical protein ACLT8H_10500 [Streptococcus parasanguinis]
MVLLFIYTDSIWLVVAQHGTWNYAARKSPWFSKSVARAQMRLSLDFTHGRWTCTG